MPTNPTIATDSPAELHKLIGDDATATFENDPTFIDSNPTASASSENLGEQRTASDQGSTEPISAKSADVADDEEDDEDLEDDDLEDDEDEDDLEDDDLEDEDEDEDDLDEEEDDDEDEEDDDEDEVAASASSPSTSGFAPSLTLWADGLLGYEDEADDARKGVDRVTGDVERERAQGRNLTDDPNEDPNDAFAEVDPEAEREEQDDTNVVIRPVKPADMGTSSVHGAA